MCSIRVIIGSIWCEARAKVEWVEEIHVWLHGISDRWISDTWVQNTGNLLFISYTLSRERYNIYYGEMKEGETRFRTVMCYDHWSTTVDFNSMTDSRWSIYLCLISRKISNDSLVVIDRHPFSDRCRSHRIEDFSSCSHCATGYKSNLRTGENPARTTQVRSPLQVGWWVVEQKRTNVTLSGSTHSCTRRRSISSSRIWNSRRSWRSTLWYQILLSYWRSCLVILRLSVHSHFARGMKPLLLCWSPVKTAAEGYSMQCRFLVIQSISVARSSSCAVSGSWIRSILLGYIRRVHDTGIVFVSFLQFFMYLF